MFYRYNDIRYSDVAGNTLSLGNIPIRIESNQCVLTDPSPLVPPTDPDGCDTPNLSMRTAPCVDVQRVVNRDLRRLATKYLRMRLGDRKALPFCVESTDPVLRSVLAIFGQFNTCEIDAIRLTARSRSGQYNPRIPTYGDPQFRLRSGRYRRFRRFDTDPRLVDSGWFTSHHFATRKDTAR